MVVRRTLEESKASRAGGIIQVSFARFRTWMSVSNIENTRLLDIKGIVAICGDPRSPRDRGAVPAW